MERRKEIIQYIGPPTTANFYVLGKSVLETVAFSATANHVENLKHRNIHENPNPDARGRSA